MDPRDDDIDFDFFSDEPATTEAQSVPARVRLPRRGGRGTGMRRPRGPARGLTPLVRLLIAVVILVVVLVFFGLAIQSCASTSKHDAYQSYLNDVAKIARSSQADGTAFANALTTPGVKTAALATTLDGIAASEQQNLVQAEKLDPPGKLRPENQHLIDALQLRIDGVRGIAATLKSVANAASTTGDAATLADQASRLTASDIVWSDLFHAPAYAQLQKDGVKGVPVPTSSFVVNSALVTEHSLSGVLQRLKGAATGEKPSGLHGTNLVSVVAEPGDKTLEEGTQNAITATTNLAFKVTIEDSGDFQEVDIKITLTIQQTPAIVKTLTIPVINTGTQKTVTFTNLGEVQFARTEQLLVNVAAVPGEQRLDNNKATFPVIFSLG